MTRSWSNFLPSRKRKVLSLSNQRISKTEKLPEEPDPSHYRPREATCPDMMCGTSLTERGRNDRCRRHRQEGDMPRVRLRPDITGEGKVPAPAGAENEGGEGVVQDQGDQTEEVAVGAEEEDTVGAQVGAGADIEVGVWAIVIQVPIGRGRRRR